MSEAAIFAFGAGVVATVNPCGFAMLPSFLAFYLGDSEGAAAERGLLSRAMSGFAVGLVLSAAFASVFVLSGVVVSIGIRELLDVVPWVAAGIGVVLLALGVAMLAGRHIGLTAAGRVRVDRGGTHGYRRVAAFGVGYALASLSCTLAIFLIVVGQASAVGDPLGIAAVFAAFAAGAATVLVAVCLSAAVARGALVRTLRRALPVVNRLAGGLLALTGAYLLVYWLPLLLDKGSTGTELVLISDRISSALSSFFAQRTSLLVAAFAALSALGFALWALAGRRPREAVQSAPEPSDMRRPIASEALTSGGAGDRRPRAPAGRHRGAPRDRRDTPASQP